MSEERISQRTYLVLKAMEVPGTKYPVALEAVASTAIEHPEWDMDELRTWEEWERDV